MKPSFPVVTVLFLRNIQPPHHVYYCRQIYRRGALLSDQNVRELIIIGGGPAGYTAALYAARADLEPLVIEGVQWGGPLMMARDVENCPGCPGGVTGREMMAGFRRQAERFGAEFLTDDVT